MYTEHFGIAENPFSITPDPRYVFLSERHQEALAHLLYGVGEGGGFVLLTGEVGTGKTTTCRLLLERLPDDVDVALILNPRLSALELLAAICDELGVAYDAAALSMKGLVDALNEHLLAAHARGRASVLIIDEAQNLTTDVLEQIRLLTNLETPTRKLLQIILVAQPELNDMLERPELRQLAQRITARYHLTALSESESRDYVRHRLRVSGIETDVFTRTALAEVHRLSGGVPRLINSLCDRCLLAAFTRNAYTVDKEIVRAAGAEVFGPAPGLPHAIETKEDRVGGTVLAWLSFAAVVFAGLVFAAADPLGLGLVPEHQRATIARHLVPALRAVHLLERPQPDAAVAPAMEIAAAGPAAIPAALPPTPAETDAGTAPPAPADPGPLTVPDQIFAGPIRPDHLETAYRALFALWGADYDSIPGFTPCSRAKAAGLACLQGNGSWGALERLNRPALITLAAPSGKRVTALLTGIGDGQVRLVVQGRQAQMPPYVLNPYWPRQYLLLWRPPPFHRGPLKAGMQGQDVAWLRVRLDRLAQDPEPVEDAAVFDPRLAERVTVFQRAESILPADGTVGPETLIRINTLSGEDGLPLLVEPTS